uniref:Uncharacterized protein n=1 Tax=Panagrolaimus sp. ES5 TaxID=591445 RepID=A0AC34G5D5_9BILA
MGGGGTSTVTAVDAPMCDGGSATVTAVSALMGREESSTMTAVGALFVGNPPYASLEGSTVSFFLHFFPKI